VALACAAFAAILIVLYLVWRPPLSALTKVWLLFALGVFPLGAAAAGNVEGMHASKQRTFCSSCHVMLPYTDDSNDRASASLASRHGRSKLFGDENCYVCHADYGMYGTLLTKLGGLGHVYRYYDGEYRTMPLEESKVKIHLHAPFKNENCMQCHSTETALWLSNADHKASLDEVRRGQLSCASSGCHGYAHPFNKPSASSNGIAPAPSGSR
jgi:nitrate/TMAO reductase-like tetraheme cytochrome c subunit